MKNKMILRVVFFLCFVLLTGRSHAEELIARVIDWPPFYVEKNGEWNGLTVEAYQVLLHEAGLPYSFKDIPWKRALNNMKKQPVIMGHLTPLEERKSDMYFIGPHFNEVIGVALEISFINEKIEALDDLVALCEKSGKQIGYQQGAYYSKEFNGRIKTDPEFSKFFFKRAKYLNIGLKMIDGGRLLGIMDERVALDYSIKIEGYHGKVAVHDYEVGKTPVYFGVSKTISNDALKKLQAANKILLSNGTYEKLLKKWLAESYP